MLLDFDSFWIASHSVKTLILIEVIGWLSIWMSNCSEKHYSTKAIEIKYMPGYEVGLQSAICFLMKAG
jgi:hypothetical protein